MHTLRCQLPRPEKLSQLALGLGLKGLREWVRNNWSQLALDLFQREGQSSHSSPWHTSSHTHICQGVFWESSTTVLGSSVVASILFGRKVLRWSQAKFWYHIRNGTPTAVLRTSIRPSQPNAQSILQPLLATTATKFSRAQNESQIRSVNLTFTFESQIRLGFVFEKPISDESETRNPISD